MFFGVRMGCLGLIVFGWLLVLCWLAVAMLVGFAAAALYLTAFVGISGDAALELVPSYRARRDDHPLRWPAKVAAGGTALVAAFFAGRRRPVPVVIVRDESTSGDS